MRPRLGGALCISTSSSAPQSPIAVTAQLGVGLPHPTRADPALLLLRRPPGLSVQLSRTYDFLLCLEQKEEALSNVQAMFSEALSILAKGEGQHRASGYRVLSSDLPEKRLSEKGAEAYRNLGSAPEGAIHIASGRLPALWPLTGAWPACFSLTLIFSENEEYWDDLRAEAAMLRAAFR